MNEHSATLGILFGQLKLDARALLQENRVLRRVLAILVAVTLFTKTILVIGEMLEPPPSRLALRVQSESTRQAQSDLQRTHAITGKILDSIANDNLVNFYAQFSSPKAASMFLQRFALGWDEIIPNISVVNRNGSDHNVSIGIYDATGRLRAWYLQGLTSPTLDTQFTATAVLERRSRLTEIDSDVQQLCYTSFRRLFSKQGIPIGYVGVRKVLATRRLGDSMLVNDWSWTLSANGGQQDIGLRFLASTDRKANGMVFIDSNERGTAFGYFVVPETQRLATGTRFRPVLYTIQGMGELLLTIILALLTVRILRGMNKLSVPSALLVWVFLSGAVIVLRGLLYMLGGLSGWVTSYEPSSAKSVSAGFGTSLLSTPEILISACCLSLIAYFAYEVSARVSAAKKSASNNFQSIVVLVGAIILPLLLLYLVDAAATVYLTRGIGNTYSLATGALRTIIGVAITAMYLSIGISFATAYRLAFYTLVSRLTSPAARTAALLALCLFHVMVILSIPMEASGFIKMETLWIGVVIVVAILALGGSNAQVFNSIRSALHPTVVFTIVCSVTALVATARIVGPLTATPVVSSRILPSPTQVIVEYVASTSDSATRSQSVYNTRAFDFWRQYLSRDRSVGVDFRIRDPNSGKLLVHFATADAVLGFQVHADSAFSSVSADSDEMARASVLVDSSGGVRLSRLLGGTRVQLEYSLLLTRSQQADLLPIARIGPILWGRAESETVGSTWTSRPIHLWGGLVLFSALLAFGLLVVELFLRMLMVRPIGFRVSLQERLLLIVVVFSGAVSVVVYLVSDHALHTNTERASAAVFSRTVAQIRHDLKSTAHADSSGVVERHLATAAEHLNCDVAIFDENNLLVTSSMPDCFRYDLLPVTLPSGLLVTTGAEENARVITLANVPVLTSLGSVRMGGSTRPTQFLVMQRKESYEALHAGVSNRLFDVLAFGVLVVLILTSYLSSRLTRPLRVLRAAADDVASGTSVTELPAPRSDEIGALVQSFTRMTAELSARREHVAQIEREGAWKEMARQVAHEIKNPLTPMKLSIQHVQHAFEHQDTNFPNIFRRVIKTLAEQIDVLTRIATEFARFGEMPRRRYAFLTLSQVVDSAVALFEADRAHIRFAVNIPDSLSKIYADEAEFRRALVNLLKNAVQAISGWGVILISAEERSGLIYLRISDSGAGMKPETVSKAFDPNFSTKTSGMGLGLAIVKRTITDMSGTIRVESEVGKGTTFFIELPARDPNAIQG